MKKFILQLIQFLSIAIAIVSMLFFVSHYFIEKNSKFEISQDIDKIFIGHSHSECSYDDSLISNSANFSSSGESYFYNYFKTIQLLKQNKNIKTIFVEFSNNQIQEDADEWIWGEEYMSHRYPLYAPFMGIEDQKLLLTKNSNSFLKSLSIFFRRSMSTIADNDYDYSKKIGGYRYLERNETESLLNKQENTDLKIKNHSLSTYNLKYLKKIINASNENNVKIYLIRSPLHPKFKGLANEDFFKKVLKTRFSDVEFLDFKDFPLNNDEFGDLQHLNFTGARKFSLFFNELLSDGLLEKKDKQAFINDEIKGKNTLSPAK